MGSPGAGAGSVARHSQVMAVATVVSRATGFLRLAVLVAVLGLGSVRQAFEVANNLPNSLYELLLGGVVTSTLVPLLVEAKARDADGGKAFAQRLLGLVLVASAGLAVLAVLFAPGLVRLYSTSADRAQIALAVRWARFFLPQIVFYGLATAMAAVLNSRGRFAAAMWAPILNNVVVIVTLVLFVLVPGPRHPSAGDLSMSQLVVLGVGTTAGVVAMTVAVLPSLYASGTRLRVSLRVRGMGLRRLARAAGWTLLYVLMTQVAYLVLSRLATGVGQQPTYATAFTIWQLPHAVATVSVITALLPRMSQQAVEGRLDLLRRSVDQGVRLVVMLLVPAVVLFVVLGRQVAVVLFAHGATSHSQAERVGWVLTVFAFGLVPFSVYQLQARAFYALRDTRSPALIQVAVSVVLILVDVALSATLPDHLRVYGLAAGHAGAYTVGVALSRSLLRRSLGPRLPSAAGSRSPIGQVLPKVLTAGALAAGVATAVALAGQHALPHHWADSALILLTGATLGGAAYLAAGLLLHVEEALALSRALRIHLTR